MVSRDMPDGDSSFFAINETGLSRDTYRRHASKFGHYFVSAAGEFGVEQMDDDVMKMLLGQVGIFPFDPSVVERLGDSYPFLYNSGKTDEAYSLAAWVAENYEQATEMVEPYVQHLRKIHDQDRTLLGFWDSMDHVISQHYETHRVKKSVDGKKDLLTTVYEVASKLGDKFTLDVFLDVLEEHVTWLKPWGRKGTLQVYGDVETNMPTLYDLRTMLDNVGWVDQCDAGVTLKCVREPIKGVLDG
jgi:hypothetical protein